MELTKQEVLSTPLLVIEIPKYIRTYKRSEKQLAKHYEKGKKQLPKSFCNKEVYEATGVLEPDNVNYGWSEFPVVRQGKKKMIEFLVDLKTGQRIVANPASVGKPKVVNINGQSIYNGNIRRHDRNNMIGAIKDSIRKYIEEHKMITKLPLRIEVEVHDQVVDDVFSNGQDWDLENRFFPYSKAIHDVMKKILFPDDSIKFITIPAHPIFVPLPVTGDADDRKLIIKVYQDDREIIKQHPKYKHFFNGINN